ncbi:MAG: transporter substrate-binding domain-containing protein [bacterium]
MDNKLRIAVGDFSPLIVKNANQYTGFEIELWEAVAKEAGIHDFDYEQLPFSQIIPVVAAKKYDIGLSGLTINSEREKVVDFSHPTLDSGSLILVNKNGGKTKIIQTLQSFFKEGYKLIISPLIFVFIFIIVFGHLFWFVEKDAHTLSSNYITAIFESFWFIICTMSTDSFGDYVPHTWAGRVITAFTIVGGVAIFGLLIAQVTAFLAVKKIKGEINNYHDLVHKSVVTLEHSTNVDVLKKIGAKVVEVSRLEDAYKKLANMEVDALVFDAPIIEYFIKEQGVESEKFSTIGDLFAKQKYGIALQSGSPLREKVNQAILRIRESGIYDSIYQKWFGEDTLMEV